MIRGQGRGRGGLGEGGRGTESLSTAQQAILFKRETKVGLSRLAPVRRGSDGVERQVGTAWQSHGIQLGLGGIHIQVHFRCTDNPLPENA